MRVLVAPDGFKGSLTAAEAAAAIARGWASVRPADEVVTCPLSDGGEGFVEALAAGGGWREVPVTNALGESITAPYVRLAGGDVLALELSAAAGLVQLAPTRRDPLLTTTYGVGEVVAAAWAEAPFRAVLLGLGGSATVDGGAGLLEALGVRGVDAEGRPVPRGGGGLARLAQLDLSALHPALREAAWTVAVDVDNPLLGPRGAARVFGPQKGADPPRVEALEAALTRWADLLAGATGRDVRDLPGTGAAGGVLAGLLAVGSRVTRASGFELVAEAVGLEARLAQADLVVTGEGALDASSFEGKVGGRLARLAAARGLPCLVIAGSLEPEGERQLAACGGAALTLVPGPMAVEDACTEAPRLLEAAAARLARLWLSAPRTR